MSDERCWYLLGAGAMGCMLAEQLRDAGQPVVLLHHGDAALKRVVHVAGQRVTLRALPLAALPRGSVQRLLLTTKAGQLAAALAGATPWLARNPLVLTTANGLGFEAAVMARMPALTLHRAVSTAAAYRDDSGTVHVVTRGRTRAGTPGVTAAPPAWFSDSLATLGSWDWEPHIDAALGEKFSLNCVINALTATLRCRNGQLLDGDEAGPELALLCAESEPALRALHLWQGARPLAEAAAEVCRHTADNQSSMLQDVIAGRTTEIAFLNGELVRRTAPLGLRLDRNRALVTALTGP